MCEYSQNHKKKTTQKHSLCKLFLFHCEIGVTSTSMAALIPHPFFITQTLPVYRQYKASLNIQLVQSLATFNISVKFRAMYSVIFYFCGLNLTLIINYSLDLPFVWFIHKFLCFISVVMFTLILDPVLNFVKTPPAHGFSHIS